MEWGGSRDLNDRNALANGRPAPFALDLEEDHPTSALRETLLPSPTPLNFPLPPLTVRRGPNATLTFFRRPFRRAEEGVESQMTHAVTTNENVAMNDSPDSTATDGAMAAAQEVAPSVESKTCGLCMDEFEGATAIATHFPVKCGGCSQHLYCRKCLKDWFLDACRNESKMPPKCCVTFPISAVAGDLSLAEINLYKAKYEEWNTPDRIYCPIRTCSTFIPPRQYIQLSSQSQVNNSMTPGDVGADQAQPSTTITRPSVSCPACQTSICISCRSQTHIEPCPASDLEPDLQETLTRLNIKRCPKCRAGIRKMFGCSHVACLCGAHFCWGCLESINACGGDCGQGGEDDEEEEEETEDLDAGAYDGNGVNFGAEPVTSTVDQWGCVHQFVAVKKPDTTVIEGYQQGECVTCFRSLTFSGLEDGQASTHTGWECERCGQNICGACRSARGEDE